MAAVQESPVLPIHGSGYGLRSDGPGRDADGTWSGDWCTLMAKVGGSFVPIRRFQDQTAAVDYVQVQLRAARERRKK